MWYIIFSNPSATLRYRFGMLIFAHLVNKNKIIFFNILFQSVYMVYNRHKFKVCPILSNPPYIYCLYCAICVTIILY